MVKTAMKLFDRTTFYTTVNHLKDLPNSDAEVVFVGRSNAGKSSVINTLTRQTRLAFVSKTPGRTQHINFLNWVICLMRNVVISSICQATDLPKPYDQYVNIGYIYWVTTYKQERD